MIKGTSETIENETKEQKGRFLCVLLGTLGDSLLRNMVAGKRAITVSQGRGVIRADEGTIRAGQDF